MGSYWDDIQQQADDIATSKKDADKAIDAGNTAVAKTHLSAIDGKAVKIKKLAAALEKDCKKAKAFVEAAKKKKPSK